MPANVQGGALATSSGGSSTTSPSASATAKSEGLLTVQLSHASLVLGAAAVLALLI
jgi:hypothetical protein